jgi:hypothetical protein
MQQWLHLAATSKQSELGISLAVETTSSKSDWLKGERNVQSGSNGDKLLSVQSSKE